MNIQKSITINAPVEKLWNVLILDAYNKLWFSEFSPGSYAESDWKEGSKIYFLDSSGIGLAGKVEVHKPNEIVSIRYFGVLDKGTEHSTGEEAQKWNGKTETYKARKSGDGCELAVELEMPPEYVDSFSEMWERALKKIKQIAEEN